jgi:dipeptidyl aminopeptidase/acylaminoacyl peptidase
MSGARRGQPRDAVRPALAPFLIMHGTSDPTVGFINGLAFY